MPRVNITYDHIHVTPRTVENFVELFEVNLRAALLLLRPNNTTFKILLDPRAQSPLCRNLPRLDVVVFYHAEWNFSDEEKASILESIRPFLEEFSRESKLRKDDLTVRLYRLDGYARISI